MKAVVEQKYIKYALEVIERSLKPSNVYLTMKDNILYVSATNANMTNGVTVRLPVDTGQEWSGLLAMKAFYDVIKNLQKGNIVMTRKEGYVHIKHESGLKAKFLLYNQDLYTPAATKDELYPAFEMKTDLFRQTVDAVAFAAADKAEGAGREFLQSVLFRPHNQDGFDVAATNMFLMAHAVIHTPHNLSEQLLIPALNLATFSGIIHNNPLQTNDTVTCAFNDHSIVLSDGIIDFFIRPLESKFPMIEHAYPDTYSLAVCVATGELLTACNAATAYGTSEGYLEIQEITVRIQGEEIEEGGAESTIAATVNGEKRRFKLSLKYLREIAVKIKTPFLNLNTNPESKRKSLVFSPTDGSIRYSFLPLEIHDL